jgi:carbon-monoxide dehydrogenase medium subunit
MKPAPFDYHAPTSLDDAVRLLALHGGDARLLAGGQTLLPMMNFRLATPEIVIDLNRIPELAYIEAANGRVRIGAMTRQRAIEFSPIVERDLPLLRAAIKMVGHLPTRSRGTIGGSIANADPAAEIPMVFQALEGEVRVRGPKGERTIPAAALISDAMTTSLAADEILIEVSIPVMPAGARFAVEEFSRRRSDFALAAVAVMLTERGGRCERARIAIAGVSSRATRAVEAERVLEGHALHHDRIAQAAEAAVSGLEPLADRHAGAEYRRHLARVLTARALERAWG